MLSRQTCSIAILTTRKRHHPRDLTLRVKPEKADVLQSRRGFCIDEATLRVLPRQVNCSVPSREHYTVRFKYLLLALRFVKYNQAILDKSLGFSSRNLDLAV